MNLFGTCLFNDFFNKIIIEEEWVGTLDNISTSATDKGCGTIITEEKVPTGGSRCIITPNNETMMKCMFKFERTCNEEQQKTVVISHKDQNVEEENHSVDVCELDVNGQIFDLDKTITYNVINKLFYLK